MGPLSMAERLTALEVEVAELKKQLEQLNKPEDWLDVVCGSFANDPAHEEAMRLGRKWRESFRPKAPKNKKAANGRPRQRSPKSVGKPE